ncbi:Fic family protein [Rhizobium sp. Root483D2]|uniref:Fic family protein n=1 Tax=Rhizobium sp. Root483D2 TaxID=1736545 RepID=UPI0007159B5B|nr:Fic family protein [Rhizobium sp. Root483D2]KQY36504.1 cell filamentation protein Fic [Rhizobium sp. Root483D2]
MTDTIRRHSIATEAYIITDAQERAEAEARNGLLQYDTACKIIFDAIEKGAQWKLRPSALLSLHREALQGISHHAGNYRPASVEIQGSKHKPVEAHLVPELIEELCDYINAHWNEKTAIHLASYAMWRLNWIHPFSDGNGRTSRMISYVVLCVKLGLMLPGRNTIPDQIVDNRRPYFEALEQADQDSNSDVYDLSKMEALMETMLAVQLASVMESATGKPYL